jgi:hypothetical protein
VGRLSAAMKLELERPAPAVAFVVSLTIAGTTYRFGALGEPGRLHAGAGLYEPRVMSWGGEFARGVNVRENTLEFVSLEILLNDTDQALARIFEGANRNAVRGSTLTLVLASPNVAANDWLTLYTGRVETIGQPSALTWTVQVAPRDLPLQRESIPKATVGRASWPNAELEVLDRDVPLIYGKHSSVGGTNAGAVPTMLVDKQGFRYLVAAGWLKAVSAVYKDGVDVAASNYSVTHPIVNGRLFTLIDFTADQGAGVITCDVEGLETVGDGSGTLISDPAAIARHAITNFIYNDWKRGAYFASSTAPVDATSFGTTYFSTRLQQASLYIGSRRRGVDVIQDFLGSFEAKCFWTFDGKLALHVEDYSAWSYVTGSNVLREDEIEGWNLLRPVATLVDRVEAEYGLVAIDGSYAQKLVVADLGTGELAPDKVQLPFSAAFVL